MRDRKHILIATLAGMLLLTAASAWGQIVHGQPAAAGTRVIYDHWTLKVPGASNDLSQFMIPLSGFVPLAENLEARFFISEVANSVTEANADYSLSGLTDARLQISQALANDRLLVSLGLNLPTGKKGLDTLKESRVAEYLSYNFLTLPIRRLGEGLGINLLLGAAGSSGDTRYGATVTYQMAGAYEAYQNKGDYNPGDLLNLTASVDISRAKLRYVGDATVSTFTTDKLDDRKVFRQSALFDLHVGAMYDGPSMDVAGDARYLIRGRNTTYDTTAAETIRDQLKIYGNELFLSGSLFWSHSAIWHAGPTLEWRYIGINEYDFGASQTVGLGAEYGRTLGASIQASVGLKYYTGSADDGRYDLSGYQMTLGLSSTF